VGKYFGIDLLDNSIVEGASILVAGNPGTGKTTLGAQFLWNGLAQGEPGLYVSFIETREEFLKHFSLLGMDLSAVRFLDLATISKRAGAEEVVSMILDEASEINARRVVVDPINVMLAPFSAGEARAMLHSLINLGFKRMGITSVLIVELPIGREAIGMEFEEFLADVIVLLKLKNYRGLKMFSMEVRKLRYGALDLYELDYTIGRGGVKVFAPYRREVRGSYDIAKRVSSGLSKLDEVLGGGYFYGSSVLIVGGVGTGKTLMCSTMAVRNSAAGVPVLYISFEESADQIRGLMESLARGRGEGLGNVSVISPHPRSFTPASLYDEIRRIIDEFKPRVVVLDGVDSLAKSYGVSKGVLLVEALTMLCKEGGLVVVATASPKLLSSLGPSYDTVVQLKRVEEGANVRYFMRVLKCRGVPHVERAYEYRFTEEGVEVVEV